MQRFSRTLLVLAAMCVVATPAWCWGQPGHRIVAMIAEQRLSPEIRGRVSQLLLDGQFTMPDVSACADALRAAETGKLRAGEEYCVKVAGGVPTGSSPWHYIDIPVPVTSQSHSLERYCRGGNCVVGKIESFTTVLNSSHDDAERRMALLYLIHFVGDIYQPLHCVERKCDQGGNLEHVNFFLKDEERADHRLHAVWDSDLVEKSMLDAHIEEERLYAASLLSGLNEIDAAKWSRESFEEVAWEGHAIAKQHVYRGIPQQNYCGGEGQPARPEITDLSSDYENEGALIARGQLLKAGVRLAALLEENLTR